MEIQLSTDDSISVIVTDSNWITLLIKGEMKMLLVGKNKYISFILESEIKKVIYINRQKLSKSSLIEIFLPPSMRKKVISITVKNMDPKKNNED